MTEGQEKRRNSQLTNAHNDYETGLNSYAFFKVHNRMVSEELVQDTFMKTWAYLVKGGKVLVMRAFLYHVLNDLIVDEYRKGKTDSLDTMMNNGFSPSTNYSERLPDLIDGRKALHLIESLPVKYRKVMRLRHVRNLSVTEIALITQQSRNAVAVQTHRGLAKLKLLYARSLEK